MGNKTTSQLEIELFEAIEELKAADKVMLALDHLVEERKMNSRSLVSDLRLNYGTPHEYKHLSKDIIEKFRKKYFGD